MGKEPKKAGTFENNPLPATTYTSEQGKNIQQPTQAPRWLGWFLFVLACLLYANTLTHQYAFDDSIVIVENSFTKKGLAGIYELSTRDFFDGIYGNEKMNLAGGRYRPLSLVMFAIEYEIFGANPFVGHLVNILLYGLSALLIFELLKRLFAQADSPHLTKENAVVVAFISTFLFVVLPVHTEVVANIKSRDEILALLLSVSALLCLDKAVKKESFGVLIPLGMFLFFGAMLAKENAFVFTLLIPLSLYLFYNKEAEAITRYSLPFWVTAGAYFGLRYAMVGGLSGVENPDVMENPFFGIDFNQKFGTIGHILLKYLQVIVAPFTLSCDYSFNQIPYTGLTNPLSLAGWGIYALMGVLMLKSIQQKTIYAYGILLYLLPLGMTSNILFNIGAPMGERFVYMSSLGYAICVGGAAVWFFRIESWQNLSKKPLLMLLLVLVGGAYAFKIVQRNPDWYNNQTLFAADVKNSPNSAKMRYYYGNTLLGVYLAQPDDKKDMNLLNKAEQEFMKAYQLNPKFHTAIYNLGNVYWNKGNGQEAKKYLDIALQLQPTHINSTELLGKVYARFLNQPAKAIELLEKSINTFQRKTADNYGSLGIAYAMSGNVDKGIELVKKALEVDAQNFAMWQNLAALYAQKGNTTEAEACMQKSKALQAAQSKK